MDFFYFAASWRAQASAARICSRLGCETTAWWSITRPTNSLICGKPMVLLTKALTATSLAALSTAGNVPPISPALRAQIERRETFAVRLLEGQLPRRARLVCTLSLATRAG